MLSAIFTEGFVSDCCKNPLPPPKKTNPLKFSFLFYNFICIEHSTSNMKIKNQINKALAIIVWILILLVEQLFLKSITWRDLEQTIIPSSLFESFLSFCVLMIIRDIWCVCKVFKQKMGPMYCIDPNCFLSYDQLIASLFTLQYFLWINIVELMTFFFFSYLHIKKITTRC